jgi:hypothetical protein
MNNQRATQSAPAHAQDSRPAACAGWFESTWDLIRGLDVRELSAAEFFGRDLQALPSAT